MISATGWLFKKKTGSDLVREKPLWPVL